MPRPPARPRADDVFKAHKPSAMACEARLRGRERSMYSKTITSTRPAANVIMGEPGSPTLPPAGGPGPHAGEWGNPVSPFPYPWKGGRRPPVTPCPNSLFAVLWSCGILSSVIHAARAAPRRDEHTSWEGCALPNPPRGRGLGARAGGPRPQGDNRVLLGGQSPPRPSRGWGYGETGFPHTPCRGLMFTLVVHAARAAQRRNEHKVLLGRAAPSQTLPGGGAWVRGPEARVR